MEKKHANYSYFSHRTCEYFPCHAAADPENFNCLFCYCPLYVLGSACGGNYRILENGVKDCSDCLFPHQRENYESITKRFGEVLSVMKKQQQEDQNQS